jgi:hypothetical protein
MALRDAFVNIAKNAAAGAAQRAVSGLAGSLRSGLGGSSSSSASSPLQTNFTPEPGILLYPSDVGTNMHQASYILFARHSVSGAKVKSPNTAPRVDKIMKIVGDDFGAAEVEDKAATRKAQQKVDAEFEAKQDRGGAGRGGSSNSMALKGKNVQKIGTVIGLYMPPAVNVSYNMDYTEGEVGVVTEAVAGLFKAYQAGTLGIGSILNEAKNVGSSVVKQIALKGISKVPFAEGAEDVYAMQTGAIVAPRMEMFFKGIGRRSFSFTFTFIPKDRTETKIVHDIIKEFKVGMSATFTTQGSTRDIKIPDMFSIQYMHINSQNQYINKIGKCYLKTIDVSYGGDKFVTYNEDLSAELDGVAPQKTTINLSFQEIEIMDRSNIEDGF